MFSKISFLCFVVTFGYISAAGEKPTVRFGEKDTAKIVEAILSCLGNTNFKADTVFAQIKEGKFTEDRAFQEFIYCSFEKSDSLTDNGRVDVDKVVSMFPNDVDVKDLVTECGNEVGKDTVETTFKFFKCFQVKSPVAVQFT